MCVRGTDLFSLKKKKKSLAHFELEVSGVEVIMREVEWPNLYFHTHHVAGSSEGGRVPVPWDHARVPQPLQPHHHRFHLCQTNDTALNDVGRCML